MSTITVETLLSDVKRLVIRLQRHDTAADSLIDQAIALKKKTESQSTCPADPEDTEFSAAESNEEGGASQWESVMGDDGASGKTKLCVCRAGKLKQFWQVLASFSKKFLLSFSLKLAKTCC